MPDRLQTPRPVRPPGHTGQTGLFRLLPILIVNNVHAIHAYVFIHFEGRNQEKEKTSIYDRISILIGRNFHGKIRTAETNLWAFSSVRIMIIIHTWSQWRTQVSNGAWANSNTSFFLSLTEEDYDHGKLIWTLAVRTDSTLMIWSLLFESNIYLQEI